MSELDLAGPTKLHRSSLLSALIHGAAAVLSAAGLVALLRSLPVESEGRTVFAVAVYGASLILAFASSALYHGRPHGARVWIAATLDHCAIFILIAGTYTPVGLIALRERGGIPLVAIEWVLALLGVAARMFWIRRLHRLSIPIYVAMGWLGLAWYRPLLGTMGPTGLALIVAGGVAYTSGILMYRWKSLPFHNAIWHVFVVVGAALHFWAIAAYVLPAAARGAGLP